MKKYNLLFLSFLIIACVSPEVKESSLSQDFFERMPGKWQLENSTTIEKWEKDGELYKATVYKPLGKESLVSERIRLIEREGEIYFEATVRGQNKEKPVPFKLIESGKDRVVFENKNHDFPQSITYQLTSEDQMVATIEGRLNGKPEKYEFNYSRIRENK
jgi:hypothetical protein